MSKTYPSVEIFSQGEEVITGQTVDTNAAWLSQKLVQMGFNVTRHTAVGDRIDALVTLLREISTRADCCICTGGLGPTEDDLTATAVSKAFDCPLKLDPIALINIENHYRRLERPMPEVNRKQALFPDNARRIDNDWGTAPGFSIRADQCRFVFMPGVPYEMRNMFSIRIQPELEQRFELKPWRLVTMRTVGIGESGIQQKINNLTFPKDVVLSFRAGPLEVNTKLLFPPGFPETEMRYFVNQVAEQIGKQVFCVDGLEQNGGNLVYVIGKELNQRKQTISVLETISSGEIASRCGGEPWFRQGTVMCDKNQLYGLYSAADLSSREEERIGQAVETIAGEVKIRSGTDYGMAQLWTFDYDSLHCESQTIRLYTGLTTPQGQFHYACTVGGRAKRKQTVASTVALDMLRRDLQGFL